MIVKTKNGEVLGNIETFECDALIEKDGRFFAWCRIDAQNNEMLVEETGCFEPENEECSLEDEITCPNCYGTLESWELDNSGELECEQCGCVYEYQRDVVVTYCTTVVTPGKTVKVNE